jgi:hypothetical protein
MSNNPKLLQNSFEEFCRLVYPEAALQQQQEMRLCFMAGAESLRRLMSKAGEHGIEGVAIIDEYIYEELSTFHENTISLFEFEGTPQ